MPFTLSAWILAAGVLTACPRPVSNPVDPADDPTASKPDPDDADTIEPAAAPPTDAGPPSPKTPPTVPPTPEPSPTVEDGLPVQPASPPPVDPKNAPLAV
ncbi:MAG TPA: hypothetical protein VMZ28_28765 [Kofleriaceae bacterium]|nr:hypothetical protein [Kofleriaceae bacterium]